MSSPAAGHRHAAATASSSATSPMPSRPPPAHTSPASSLSSPPPLSPSSPAAARASPLAPRRPAAPSPASGVNPGRMFLVVAGLRETRMAVPLREENLLDHGRCLDSIFFMLGMAMFSLVMFMAFQPRIIAYENILAALAIAVWFLMGPAVMAATLIAVERRSLQCGTKPLTLISPDNDQQGDLRNADHSTHHPGPCTPAGALKSVTKALC
ncbi:hypothetical protein ACP70R_021586 [Stipagrostis hirtigluma subsp. patula]